MKIQNILYVISKYLDLFEQAGNLFENLIIADFVKRNQNATPASERPNVGSGLTFVARPAVKNPKPVTPPGLGEAQRW